MPEKIPRLISGQAPSLLTAEYGNMLIDSVNALYDSQGKNGIKVTVEDNGRMIVSKDESAGGEVPDGYEETSVIICSNGSPVSGSILFKLDV